MSIKNLIQDGEGTKRTAGVTSDHALKVTDTSYGFGPALIDLQAEGFQSLLRKKTWVSYFENSVGGHDLNIDGSVTPVTFKISSQEDRLKTIQYVRFIMHDTQMSLSGAEGSRFASAAAVPGLTNGVRFFIEQGGEELDLFLEPIKQIVQFMNYAVELVNEAGVLGAGEDLLTVTMTFDFAPVHIVPGGFDSINVKIQDDLSSINLFQVFGFGSQELF
jgi:hypothetical protein